MIREVPEAPADNENEASFSDNAAMSEDMSERRESATPHIGVGVL